MWYENYGHLEALTVGEKFARLILWRKYGRGRQVLVMRMKSGHITFPGGRNKVRPSEDETDALARELKEETLITNSGVRYLKMDLMFGSQKFGVKWRHRGQPAWDVYFVMQWRGSVNLPLFQLNELDEDRHLVESMGWEGVSRLRHPLHWHYRNQRTALVCAYDMIKDWRDPFRFGGVEPHYDPELAIVRFVYRV